MTQIILILLAASISWAANTGTRGGGDAVICYSGDKITSVEVLDYFEATQMGLILDLGDESLNYKEKLKLVIDRWARFDPILTDFFREALLNFSDHTAFLDRNFLKEIDDSNESILPSRSCYLKQMAVSRLEDLAPGEKKYLVDNELWNLLSETQKAGLIIHEVLWSFYKELNDKLNNSSSIRRLNAILSSTLMTKYTPEQYIQLISQLWKTIDPLSYAWNRTGAHSPSILYNGVVYSINTSLWIENRIVRRGFMPRPTQFIVGGNSFYFSGFSLLSINNIEFYSNGAVKEGRLYKDVNIVLNNEMKLSLSELYSKLEFNELGQIQKINGLPKIDGIYYFNKPYKNLTLEWNGVQFPFNELEFFETGKVKSMRINLTSSDEWKFSWKGKNYVAKKCPAFLLIGLLTRAFSG